MSDDSLENLSGPELEVQLRKRIEARLKARNDLFIHSLAFIGGNIVVWTIWWLTSAQDLAWPLFVTVPWAAALAIHAVVVYQQSGMAVERHRQEVQRQMELEKARLGLASYQKPKRDHTMRLGDDGELIADDEADLKPKRDTISGN